MDNYSIRPDFRGIANIKPPLAKPLLPLIHLVLGILGESAVAKSKIPTRTLHIPTPDGAMLPAILWEPVDANAPCLAYFHGGAFIMRAAPSHYSLAEAYAAQVGCKVLMVDYRLAPKHPFPTPAADALTTYLWVLENAKMLGVDLQRIAVGGDSAGGNLAASVSLMARDRALPRPLLQLLIYPVTDRRMNTESMRRYTDTPMWNADLTRKIWPWYLPDPTVSNLAYASPMEAHSFADLPRTYLETAQFDCLHDEGVQYADALKKAGVDVTLHETEGTIHGFDVATSSAIVADSVYRRVAFLKRGFGIP